VRALGSRQRCPTGAVGGGDGRYGSWAICKRRRDRDCIGPYFKQFDDRFGSAAVRTFEFTMPPRPCRRARDVIIRAWKALDTMQGRRRRFHEAQHLLDGCRTRSPVTMSKHAKSQPALTSVCRRFPGVCRTRKEVAHIGPAESGSSPSASPLFLPATCPLFCGVPVGSNMLARGRLGPTRRVEHAPFDRGRLAVRSKICRRSEGGLESRFAKIRS